MLTFKQYITEANDATISVDYAHVEKNKDALNAELDALTEKSYQNAPIMLAQMRGVLERYGIQLPASATNNFINLSAELVYLLQGQGEEAGDNHLYIVFDTNDQGYVDGYAQLVDSDELQDLVGMDAEDLEKEPIYQKKMELPAKAKDDDSGNDDEYT